MTYEKYRTYNYNATASNGIMRKGLILSVLFFTSDWRHPGIRSELSGRMDSFDIFYKHVCFICVTASVEDGFTLCFRLVITGLIWQGRVSY